MNIFYLSENAQECAAQHCDKHVVKMIIEYAQLLSTAHRILDGKCQVEIQNGRRIQRWNMLDSKLQTTFYKASHVNHPSAIWARQSNKNYTWLYSLWLNLCDEYTHRYDRKHLTYQKLKNVLADIPKNIPIADFCEPPPAMPDQYKVHSDSITSYRNYYIHEKVNFARWTRRSIPTWFGVVNESNALPTDLQS